MGQKMIQELTPLSYVESSPAKVDFSMYKGLGISELLLHVTGQVDTSGAITETVDQPYLIIEEITLTFDGSKTPFEIKGEDLRWVHRLYNGVESDALIGVSGSEAVTRVIAGTTNDQLITFLLKLPVFIPADLFTRGTLQIKWGAPADMGTNLTVDSFTVNASLVWDDAIPFMLNYAEESQTWSGDREFKPPFSETLRHIVVRVVDYTDVLTDIGLKKQRTTILESRYEELLAQMVDLDNIDTWPLIGSGALRYGLLVISTPSGIVSDDTTILKVKTSSSKEVHILWINVIPVAAKKQPAAKPDIMKFLKI